MKNLIAEARSLLREAKAIKGPKLTDVQIDLMSKYFTASSVGTMWGRGEPSKADPKNYVLDYYEQAVRNHDEAGIDLEPERKSFIKLIKKDTAHWVAEFEKAVGPLDKLV